jgi:hypothetical protein
MGYADLVSPLSVFRRGFQFVAMVVGEFIIPIFVVTGFSRCTTL